MRNSIIIFILATFLITKSHSQTCFVGGGITFVYNDSNYIIFQDLHKEFNIEYGSLTKNKSKWTKSIRFKPSLDYEIAVVSDTLFLKIPYNYDDLKYRVEYFKSGKVNLMYNGIFKRTFDFDENTQRSFSEEFDSLKVIFKDHDDITNNIKQNLIHTIDINREKLQYKHLNISAKPLIESYRLHQNPFKDFGHDIRYKKKQNHP